MHFEVIETIPRLITSLKVIMNRLLEPVVKSTNRASLPTYLLLGILPSGRARAPTAAFCHNTVLFGQVVKVSTTLFDFIQQCFLDYYFLY